MLQQDMGDKVKDLINEEFDDPIGMSESGDFDNLVKELSMIDQRLLGYKSQVQSIVNQQAQKDEQIKSL
jgi:hypothetical protein